MNNLISQEQNTVSHEQIFLTNVRKELGTVADSFFKIGFELYQAQNGKYYERLGYPNMETLAEEEFGFGRSTFYGLISVYVKTCLDRGKNVMQQSYIGYSYSQLLAMTKNEFSPPNYKKYIAVTDSVRDVQKYIRYWREYARKHSTYPRLTLQEWKAEQGEEIKAIPSNTQSDKQVKGQTSIEEIPSAPSKENKIEVAQTQPKETVISTPSTPAQPVQTFGQRDTAEESKSFICSIQTFKVEELAEVVKKTCNIFNEEIRRIFTATGLSFQVNNDTFAEQLYGELAKYLKERSFISKPKVQKYTPKEYNLQSRKNIREFLADYQNWEDQRGYSNYFLPKVYCYFLKNKTYIYACERKIYEGATLQLGKAQTKVVYFLQAFRGDNVSEISQNQFEQYCAENKDNL